MSVPYKKPQKYRAVKTVVDGHTFDSKAEAERYGELKLLQRDGQISNLELQPSFELEPKTIVGGRRLTSICYVADFRYLENGEWVFEDVKGVRTRVFDLKLRLFYRRFSEVDLRLIIVKKRSRRGR